jgi:hypothetical protein
MERSSSMIQTGFMGVSVSVRWVVAVRDGGVTQGQQEREAGPAGLTVDFDEPVVLADEGLRDREPEAGAALAAGDEREEHAFGMSSGMPGPSSITSSAMASR